MDSLTSIKIDASSITSFGGVLAVLGMLDKQLIRSNLSQFMTFNKAYFIVTSAIKEAAEDGYFENPLFIEKFTVCFAQYYFQAINDIASGSPKLTTAWAKMSDETQINSLPAFISLLMGANAHINHDLTLALVKFMRKEKTDYSLRDVRKVDTLLIKSGRQIMRVFDEPNKVQNAMKQRLQFLYFRPVMYTILYWRIIAWRNYRIIIKSGNKKHDFSTRSVKIALRLLWIGNVLR